MKQLVLLAVLSLAFFSCSGNKKQAETSDEAQTSVLAEGSVYELDNLLAVADQEVDKTITVVGYVTHTCKHAGKRCFIVGESQEASLRVEAKGEIGGFNRELVGSKLSITGVLKENRLSEDYLAEVEKATRAANEDPEDCETELKNINDMRKWMKEHNKDYYVIYYMDGLEFDVLD